MRVNRRNATLGCIGLLAAGMGAPKSFASERLPTEVIEGTEDFIVALDAYVYGYPLITMEMIL